VRKYMPQSARSWRLGCGRVAAAFISPAHKRWERQDKTKQVRFSGRDPGILLAGNFQERKQCKRCNNWSHDERPAAIDRPPTANSAPRPQSEVQEPALSLPKGPRSDVHAMRLVPTDSPPHSALAAHARSRKISALAPVFGKSNATSTAVDSGTYIRRSSAARRPANPSTRAASEL
jgi:hypothetical protein